MISLAIDMGGSKFIVGFVNQAGELLSAARYLWTELTSDGLVRDVKAAVHAFLAANPQTKPDVIGATIPGLADPKKGLWVEASFSGIKNLPFAKIMEDEFGLPVRIDRDTCACGLAEKEWGCCKGVDDFVWVTVSNGIGGCVFSGGRLVYGVSGNAGEIGHVVVEEGAQARPCKCGLSGCAEMHASGRGLAKNYAALGGKTIGGDFADAKAIDRMARSGDAIAIAAYEMEGLYLGRAIGAAVNLLNPQKVVIGGGVALGFDLFRPSLERTLKTHVYQNANTLLTIEQSALGYNAALLGAAVVSFAK